MVPCGKICCMDRAGATVTGIRALGAGDGVAQIAGARFGTVFASPKKGRVNTDLKPLIALDGLFHGFVTSGAHYGRAMTIGAVCSAALAAPHVNGTAFCHARSDSGAVAFYLSGGTP